MKSIISSNRNLQRSKQQASGKILLPPPSPVPPSPQPIGTQFALTMLGMHKNPSNSLQQHVSHTLGTLVQVQSSLSAPPVSSPNEKSLHPSSVSSSPRATAQKSSTFESKLCADGTNSFSSVRSPRCLVIGNGRIRQQDHLVQSLTWIGYSFARSLPRAAHFSLI